MKKRMKKMTIKEKTEYRKYQEKLFNKLTDIYYRELKKGNDILKK